MQLLFIIINYFRNPHLKPTVNLRNKERKSEREYKMEKKTHINKIFNKF
jgi:hypothetical protein